MEKCFLIFYFWGLFERFDEGEDFSDDLHFFWSFWDKSDSDSAFFFFVRKSHFVSYADIASEMSDLWSSSDGEEGIEESFDLFYRFFKAVLELLVIIGNIEFAFGVSLDWKIDFCDWILSDLVVGNEVKFSGILSKVVFPCDSDIERFDIQDFALQIQIFDFYIIPHSVIFHQDEIHQQRNCKSLKGDQDRTDTDGKHRPHEFIFGENVDENEA